MIKNWSAIRITALLYFIIILLPVNYYFAKQSFSSMQNDTIIMSRLVFISGAIANLTNSEDLNSMNSLLKEIDNSLNIIEETFINYQHNQEYVTLFPVNELYGSLKHSYQELQKSLKDGVSTKRFIDNTLSKINAFSKTAQEMMLYKIQRALDKLYLSLAFTMILIVALIFFIRLYMQMQFLKNAIHDNVTGLYNKKYFDNVSQKAKVLSVRQNKPLSLLIVSIGNYGELSKSIKKPIFEKYLKELGEVFTNFFRQSDTVCRVEKNCFAIITPDVSTQNIDKLSVRLSKEIQSKFANASIRANISIGFATYNKEESLSLLEEATKSMQDAEVMVIGDAL